MRTKFINIFISTQRENTHRPLGTSWLCTEKEYVLREKQGETRGKIPDLFHCPVNWTVERPTSSSQFFPSL